VKAAVALIKFEHGRVKRSGFEKKRVNPPIGAIKDRWIEGFVGTIWVFQMVSQALWC
jgi:hypothetical protein